MKYALTLKCFSSPGTSNNVSGPFSMGIHIPAPAPPVNAWDKPISLTTTAPTVSIPACDTKYPDKGDQHDSGIDISEPINSGASSTRSSPSAENKMKNDDIRRVCNHRMFGIVNIGYSRWYYIFISFEYLFKKDAYFLFFSIVFEFGL